MNVNTKQIINTKQIMFDIKSQQKNPSIVNRGTNERDAMNGLFEPTTNLKDNNLTY